MAKRKAVKVHVPPGFDGCWAVIRREKTFTVLQVANAVGIHRPTVADYVRRLELAGFVEKVDTLKRPFTYLLLIDQIERPRLRRDGSWAIDTGQGVANMWRSMKIADSFTFEELAGLSSTRKTTVSVATAKDYVQRLHRAGYLAQDGDRYSLLRSMNTGPLPPAIKRTKFVYDRNRKQVMGAGSDAEEVRLG
jgi:transposase